MILIPNIPLVNFTFQSFFFVVTTEPSVEQTTPTNLPNTDDLTTNDETTPPLTARPIELVTLRGPRTGDPLVSVDEPSDSQGALSTGKLTQSAPIYNFV